MPDQPACPSVPPYLGLIREMAGRRHWTRWAEERRARRMPETTDQPTPNGVPVRPSVPYMRLSAGERETLQAWFDAHGVDHRDVPGWPRGGCRSRHGPRSRGLAASADPKEPDMPDATNQPQPETVGELHDSLAPGGSTHVRVAGRTWRITRPPSPAENDERTDDDH
jgi:hypothetical protein